MTRAVFFDLDGTLIDTTKLILGCFDHSWARVCGRTLPREDYLSTFGIPLRSAMATLLGPSPVDTDNGPLIDALLAEYRAFNLANHDSMARPFKGVGSVVSELRRRGYSIGVVTSKSRELGLRGLRHCNLDSLIDTAIFLEDTDRHKPSPDPLLIGLQRLSSKPENSTYVGDSPCDIVAGKAAGMKTIAALWGPTPKAKLEGELPDYAARNAAELLDILL